VSWKRSFNVSANKKRLKPIQMKKIIFIPFVFCTFCLHAQTVEREIVGAAGGAFSNASIHVSNSVGELAVSSNSTAGLIVTQGFQQTKLNTTGINGKSQMLFDVKAYPNPTTDYLNVEFNSEKVIEVSMQIRDQLGRLVPFDVRSNTVEGLNKRTIDLSNLSSGNYILVLLIDNESAGTIHIVKH